MKVPLRFALLLLLGCAACSRETRDMAEQPRYDPAKRSPLFANEQSTRAPVAGTVVAAAGQRAAESSGRTSSVVTDPVPRPVTDQPLLARGHERYQIYCLPCHGVGGAGDGEVVRRGFPKPASFASQQVRSAGDEQLFDAIEHGYGRMLPFADRVGPADGWAIVAYLRSLQQAAPERAP
jgi:mono/diheme cytochrome c family protein